MEIRRIPGGRKGLPLLGETIAFAKNPFRFIEKRLAAHGGIFRSNVLGRDTVVLAGPAATSRFIDTSSVMREGSMPSHVQELFGGRSLPLLDGDTHRARKNIVLQGFDRQALTGYLPIIQKTIEQSFEEWAQLPEIRWIEELKRFSIEAICSTVLGMSRGAEMDVLTRDYALVTDGFATLPINLPGTRYSKALKARDRILSVLARQVAQRRATPAEDGLSRILSARADDGSAIGDGDAVLELHHIVIAGFIIFAELGTMVRELTRHPEVRKRLTEEIRQPAPSGRLTMETLAAMPYLTQVIMEVKRICPIIPAVFGKAKTSFEVDGATIPAGWMLMWAVHPTHGSHGVYSNPQAFDPDRFAPERAEHKRHEHAFVPQGAGAATGHRCPGLDFATYTMCLFAVVALRSYRWELPPQNFEYNWSKTPPEPRDGLRASVHRDR